MRFTIILLAAALSLTQCATYFKLFGEKSSFYSERELSILKKTTNAINFNYGYDPKLRLEYVYPEYKGYNKFRDDAAQFEKALHGISGSEITRFYEKVYRLQRIITSRMNEYYRTKDWKNYTYIKKYILPSLEHYANLLQSTAIKRNSAYRSIIKKRQKKIDREIKQNKYEKEFHEIWGADYHS